MSGKWKVVKKKEDTNPILVSGVIGKKIDILPGTWRVTIR
jgi:hypothetical protein